MEHSALFNSWDNKETHFQMDYGSSHMFLFEAESVVAEPDPNSTQLMFCGAFLVRPLAVSRALGFEF